MPERLKLRPANGSDDLFLRGLYADTRREEMAWFGGSQEQAQDFLTSQYDLQRHHYRAHYGEDGHSIVEYRGEPVGRLWLHAHPDHVRVVDIALLEAHRGQGIGAELLGRAKAEASQRGVPLGLAVLVWNHRAQQLYTRLGFAVVGRQGDTHLEMEWRPDLGQLKTA